MPSPDDSWLDDEAGPVVRPYAVIRGRTRPSGEKNLDLLSMVISARRTPLDPWALAPEHFSILQLCRVPISVADLASDLNLPLGAVRVLISDLRDRGLLTVRPPMTSARRHDPRILREVADGLRRL
jgi:DNA-binding transcriptional ArsR family regulator